MVENLSLPIQVLVSRTLKTAYLASRQIKAMCSRSDWLNDYQCPTVRGAACAYSIHHTNCPTVGITQHTRAAERNTTSIPEAVLLHSFICHINGYRAPLWCSKAGLRKVQLSTFQETLRLKDFKLCSSLRLSRNSVMGTSQSKALFRVLNPGYTVSETP
jgi:hypothetical protein